MSDITKWPKTALIDADSIIHITAYHYQLPKQMVELAEGDEGRLMELYEETKNKQVVFDHVDQFIHDIITSAGCHHYLGFVGARGGSRTFRHELAVTKPYKGHRAGNHWTKFWKPHIIEHMVTKWKFQELHNIEADDALGIYSHNNMNVVICSPDKDLNQLPGMHYDYKKCGDVYYVSPETAMKNMYQQLLVGDSTDNIPGCKGVGDKSPHMEFPGCVSQQDFHTYAYNVFKSKGLESIMPEQLQLVYMLRTPDGIDIKELVEPNKILKLGNKTSELIQQNNEPQQPAIPTTFKQG